MSYTVHNIVVDCGPLGTPTNGMSVVNTTTFGSVAEHNCLDGFLLCGSQSRTCQASGLWSGSLPDCISKCSGKCMYTETYMHDHD